MSKAPDDLNINDVKPPESNNNAAKFHLEINRFISQRAEEWDLNSYELIGVLAVELLSQFQWSFANIDEEVSLWDDDEDEEDED